MSGFYGADTEQLRGTTAVVVRGREEEGAAEFRLFARPGAVELMETEGQGEESVHRVAPVSRKTLDELLISLLGTEGGGSVETDE